MHLVSLQQAAGVEAHFVEFLSQAAARHPQQSQGWINPERTVHEFFAAPLSRALSNTLYAKYRWGFKLPSKPSALRVWHCRRAFKAAGCRTVVVWNRTARNSFVVDAVGANNCIHWEHGGAWHPGRERERRSYLHATPLALVNSRASARVLELLWDYPGRVELCVNALRPSLLPVAPVERAFPAGPIKLGVVARLMPVKGVAIAIHAVNLLRANGLSVQLEIAGEGVERARLEALVRHLGLEGVCKFHGAVRDMAGFYAGIDCLVHAPLTEAFGLVAIEAAAHGCPVIAASVDGLPEAVRSGVSGNCIAPSLTLAEYAALGADTQGIPAYVYDPERDALTEPRALDPAAVAAAVQTLFTDEAAYVSLTRSASELVRRDYDFGRHVDRVMRIVAEFEAERAV
jgi:glycosyltransferase involved in cell wall biosynthesis